MLPALYSYYRSSCSYRVRLALAYKKIDYDYKAIHLVKDGGEQYSEDYLKLNVKAEVPLWKEQDFLLSQSMSIMLYLDKTHPENPIFPSDARSFARTVELCEIINSGIQPLQGLRLQQEIERRFAAAKGDVKDFCRFWIELGLQAFENKISAGGLYSVGNELTAADFFLIPQLYNAKRFAVDLTSFKRLLEIEQNLLLIPHLQKATPEHSPDFSP